jgi:hypothetical protein
MFGISFLKFVVLISVILTVLYGMLRMQRYFEIKNERMWGRGQGADANKATAAQGPVEETVRCPECNFYVATNHASKCDRINCPY